MTAALLNAVALGLALCLPRASSSQDLEELVEAMTVPGWNISVYRELRQLRDPRCIPLLLRAAPRMDGRGQHSATQLLEMFPPDKAEAAFSRLLGAKSPELRFLSARWLHGQGRPGMAGAMAEALASPDLPDDRKGPILGRLRSGAPPVVAEAIARWIGPDMSPSLASNVMDHLLRTQDAGSFAAIEALIDHADRGTRLRAAAFCLRFSSKKASETLDAMLKAEDARPIDWRIMAPFLRALPQLPPRLQSILVEQLERHDEPRPLKTLLEVARDHRLPAATDRLLELLQHEDTETRRAAFATLDWQGRWKANELAPLLQSEDLLLRVKAADALRRSDDLSGLPVLIELAAKEGPHREEACRVLAATRSPQSVDVLIPALRSPDAKVREAASTGLESVLWSLYPYRRFDLSSTGYDPRQNPNATKAAVDAIQQWWQRSRNADW